MSVIHYRREPDWADGKVYTVEVDGESLGKVWQVTHRQELCFPGGQRKEYVFGRRVKGYTVDWTYSGARNSECFSTRRDATEELLRISPSRQLASVAWPMIGHRVTYSLDGKPVQGTCVGRRTTGTTIWDKRTDQEWPGVQFEVRTDDGRTFWSVTYPDKEPA